MKPNYDTSLARMAGNIAAGIVQTFNNDLNYEHNRQAVAEHSVELAYLIIQEIKKRTNQEAT